jgi:hypothetical protein
MNNEAIAITPDTQIVISSGFRLLPCKVEGRGETDEGMLFEFVDPLDKKHVFFQIGCTLAELAKMISHVQAAVDTMKGEIPTLKLAGHDAH